MIKIAVTGAANDAEARTIAGGIAKSQLCKTAFYGQDANYSGLTPSFTDNGNDTITDNRTGLMWQKSADSNGDGAITASDKLTYTEALAYPATLNAAGFGGHTGLF